VIFFVSRGLIRLFNSRKFKKCCIVYHKPYMVKAY